MRRVEERDFNLRRWSESRRGEGVVEFEFVVEGEDDCDAADCCCLNDFEFEL